MAEPMYEIRDDFAESLRLTIRTERKTKKMSQESIAAFMGCHRNQVNRWELGSSSMSLRNFVLMSSALQVDPTELLARVLTARIAPKPVLSPRGRDIQLERDPPLRKKER